MEEEDDEEKDEVIKIEILSGYHGYYQRFFFSVTSSWEMSGIALISSCCHDNYQVDIWKYSYLVIFSE